MIDNVRKSFHNANHSLYEEIRKKKNEHEKLINFEKSKILEQKFTSLDIAKIFFIFEHYIPYFVKYIDIGDKISAV